MAPARLDHAGKRALWRGHPQARDPPAISTEAASCPFFLAVTNLPLDARSVIRRSRHSMSK